MLLLALAFACRTDDVLKAPDGVPATVSIAGVTTAALSNRFAYAWADNATASSYSPNSQYSFSATGGGIRITHSGPGSGYAVTFGGFTGGSVGTETFLVTPYGSTTAHCVAGFYIDTGVSLTVNVFCIDPVQGLGTDSRFTILAVGNNALPSRSAFAYANNPAALSYTPDPNFSYTSAGGAITITHDSGAGNYRVNFGTGNPAGSVLLVNSRLTPSQCHVGEWKPVATRIRCFDSFTGSPADADYQVLQVAQSLPGRRIGFAFADRLSSASYTPNPSFSFNSSGGSVKVTRPAMGRYAVSFAGLQKLAGHTETVQVTPWAIKYANCSVASWSSSATTLTANVECRNIAGAFRDSRFEVLVIE
jgi:hypothetical protein